jgi:glutathione S-transferase
MSLTLYMHPLSSFCHKVLIALYENAIPFAPRVVDLFDPVQRDNFRRLWPMGKFPVLRDEARQQTIPESTLIIEYLGRHYPGPVKLIPEEAEAAARVRAADRFYDLHVHDAMQKVVGDKLRPAECKDPLGVEQAQDRMRTALAMAENSMSSQRWANGEQFTMADCAAAPPLFFLNRMQPLAGEFPQLAAYLERLQERPSYARVLAEAAPYLPLFPG